MNMSSKDYVIELQTRLANLPQTEKELNNEIKKLQNMVESLKFKIDETEIHKATGSFRTLEAALNSVNKDLNGSLKGLTQISRTIRNGDKETKKYVDTLGRQYEITEMISDGESRYNIKLVETNANLKKGSQAVDSLKKSYISLEEVQSRLSKQQGIDLTKFEQVPTKTITSGSFTNTGDINGFKEVYQSLDKVVTLQGKVVDGQKLYNDYVIQSTTNVKKLANEEKSRAKNFVTLEELQNKLNVSLDDYLLVKTKVKSTEDKQMTEYFQKSGEILEIQSKIIDGERKYLGTKKEISSFTDKEVRQADEWSLSWKKAFQSFSMYLSVTTVFFQTVHAIGDMITNVKELDDSLTELKKVTDLEGDSLDEFTNKAFKLGATVAKTGREMIDSSAAFAKAGYGEEEILQLGKVASMYTNITDEEISAADAAEFIIAQLKAFNLESENLNETLKNSYRVIDAVNEVHLLNGISINRVNCWKPFRAI